MEAEINSKNNDVKHMEIIDFFNNSNIVKKNTSSFNNKSQLLDNYLKVTDNKQTKCDKSQKFKPKFCKTCNIEMTLHLSDGYLICTSCGECEYIILDSDKPNYKEPVPDVTAYCYRRINHFNELILSKFILLNLTTAHNSRLPKASGKVLRKNSGVTIV